MSRLDAPGTENGMRARKSRRIAVFVPFAVLYMGQEVRMMNYLCAGLCLLGAFYFIFRG